ncbi:hypothetical protein Pelo_19845 [Pelomyxa schiedti]|nr:hypothetical protein Pelo_19845 [Pelomyxa schiedti]
MSRVCCSGVKAWRVLHEGDDLLEVLQRAIDSGSVAAPQEGDVIVVSSKVCGLIEGERFSLATIKVTSPLAAPLATKTMLPPEFIQAILDDADSIVGCM